MTIKREKWRCQYKTLECITNYKSGTERGLVRGPRRVTQTPSLFLRSVYFQFHSASSIPDCDIRTVEGTSYLLV